MAGPHPVVGVCAELADGGGGSAYHADVAIGGLYEQIVSVSTVEGFQFQLAAGCQGDAFGLGEAVGYCLQVFGRQIIGAVRVVVGFQLFVYVLCHVQYPVDVGDGESLAGKLLFAGHSPETVGQVVVFHRAVLLYGAIAAVVVGQYQAFGRDDFAGTATAEMHHGILQGNAVGIVDLVGGDEQSEFRHGYFVLLLQVGEHPHTFVGVCGKDRRCNE